MMNFRFRFQVIVPLVCLAIATASGQNPVTAAQGTDIRKIADIAYAATDDERQMLDLYLPAESTSDDSLPLLVWIHGGAFYEGSKAFCPLKPLVDKGYAVASINYRLAPKWQFPIQIEDCRAAIAWLYSHAAEYAIDPSRIGICGESAGGLLAGLLGTNPTPESSFESSPIKAIVALCAPSDITQTRVSEEEIAALFASRDPVKVKQAEMIRWGQRVLSNFLGGPLKEKQDLAKAASPLYHVTSDDVPMLLIHGDKDDLVPISQSELFAEELRAHHVPVEFHVIKGAGHGFGQPSKEIMGYLSCFFDSYLKKEDS